MHYRNGREANNGDKIAVIENGSIKITGVLFDAVPGNDYCNGYVAPLPQNPQCACLCDCLHVDDVAAMLKEKGLDVRSKGM